MSQAHLNWNHSTTIYYGLVVIICVVVGSIYVVKSGANPVYGLGALFFLSIAMSFLGVFRAKAVCENCGKNIAKEYEKNWNKYKRKLEECPNCGREFIHVE